MSGRRQPDGSRLLAAGLLVVTIGVWVLRPPAPGWLGVTVDEGDASDGRAARLTAILPESPAAGADLRNGDLVRMADGRRIARARDLTGTVRRRAAGTTLPLTIVRNGAELQLAVKLAARPPDVYRLLEIDRDVWQEPDRVLNFLGLGPASTVADLGAGGGYFTERLAARIGPDGRVIAIDVDAEALKQLRVRLPPSRFPQVVVQQGDARDPRLAAGSIDGVLMVDTYHELAAAAAVLDAVRRALRPGGRLVVVDRPAKTDTPGTHAIPEARVRAEAEAHGFRLRERHDLDRQFVLVLE